jgi:hypothetical protein
MGSDYVICFLEDVYTLVERTLIRGRPLRGRPRNAKRVPRHHAGSLLGRRRTGGRPQRDRLLSQVHINPDLAIETFILEPDGTGERAEG